MYYVCICLFSQFNRFYSLDESFSDIILYLYYLQSCPVLCAVIKQSKNLWQNQTKVMCFCFKWSFKCSRSLPSTDAISHGIMGLVPMTWSSGVHSSLGGIHCIHSAKIVKRTLYMHAIDVCIIFRHCILWHRNDSCFSRRSYAMAL